jgi:precorrin-2 dehydrogenase/sirohydrochlorin ferrochelatase
MSYVVNLAVEGRLAAVIGAGHVAARKIQALLAAGARVIVVAPQACGSVIALAQEKRIQLQVKVYTKADIDGAFVVVCATNDEEVNARVASDAASMGVLVNVVDQPALCSFTVPATVRRGNLTLAVATDGRCPALAGILRDELDRRYGLEYSALVDLFADLREAMIAQNWDGRRIRETLAELYRDGVTGFIARGEHELLNGFLRSRLRAPFPLPR